jgi:O-antigen ligase
MRALLPAGLLALFGIWCGTFYYGASAAAVALGHFVLLALIAWGWRSWDPLRLGPWGKAIPPLVWCWALLALRASDAPRAGYLAAALIPAFLALPAAVARCWETPYARRRGTSALVAVAGVTGAVALAGMAAQGSPRAAQPLGNAVLLGGFLATLLPLGIPLVIRAITERRDRARWWMVGALVVGLVALLATRSICALAGALVGGALVLPSGKRRWLLAPILGGALVLGPRLAKLSFGNDDSLRTRWGYWRAGAAGIGERPLLGHGPGSTGWTLSPLVQPRPGYNPPGEVYSDLHSLPLQIAYELGTPGLVAVAALAVVFVRARRRELAAMGDDEDLARGGLAALAAGFTTLAAGPTLSTTAGWVALAVAAGAAMSGSRADATASPAPTSRRDGFGVPRVGWLYAAIALLLLAPLDLALGCYEVARRAPPARATRWLAVAAELDPDMPLYRARLGWLATTAQDRARELGRAAALVPRVPALQLAAGWSTVAAGGDGRAELARACAGDPLGGYAPFLLAVGQPRSASAPRLAARALLADPELLAALGFEADPELARQALAEAARWGGVDEGLRSALVGSGARIDRTGPIAGLGLTMDDHPATALSLYTFRRLPWPATLAQVPVRRRAAVALSAIPPATRLKSTALRAFDRPCDAPPPRASGG